MQEIGKQFARQGAVGSEKFLPRSRNLTLSPLLKLEMPAFTAFT